MQQSHKKFFVITVSLFLLTITFLVGNLFSAETKSPRADIEVY